MTDSHSAPITEAAARALLSNRTGQPMYTASIGTGRFGEYIELSGPRGASYRSARNIHDGLHRFTERQAKSYVFAIVNGVICLPRERVAA